MNADGSDRGPSPRVVLRADNATKYRLWSYDIESGKETLLAEKVFVDTAALSPDGKEVAFYTPPDSEGEEGLWLVPRSGGKRTRLLAGMEIPSLHWSPDGKTLLFERYTEGALEI